MAPVRLGLLSTAAINAQILAGARETDLLEVVAVASRESAKALSYAAEHGIDRAHATYEALLADEGVDAVYIGLPNGMHHEWTTRALEDAQQSRADALFEDGCKATDVAQDLGVSRATAYRMQKKWKQERAAVSPSQS